MHVYYWYQICIDKAVPTGTVRQSELRQALGAAIVRRDGIKHD